MSLCSLFLLHKQTEGFPILIVCVREVLVRGLVVVALDAIRVEGHSNGGGVEQAVHEGFRPRPR